MLKLMLQGLVHCLPPAATETKIGKSAPSSARIFSVQPRLATSLNLCNRILLIKPNLPRVCSKPALCKKCRTAAVIASQEANHSQSLPRTTSNIYFNPVENLLYLDLVNLQVHCHKHCRGSMHCFEHVICAMCYAKQLTTKAALRGSMHLYTSISSGVKAPAHRCGQAGCSCRLHCLQMVMEHVQMVLIRRSCNIPSTKRLLQQNTTCVIVGCSICKADIPSRLRQIGHSCYDAHDNNSVTPPFVMVSVHPQGKIIDGFAFNGSDKHSSLARICTLTCLRHILRLRVLPTTTIHLSSEVISAGIMIATYSVMGRNNHVVPQYLGWPQIVSCISSNRCTKVATQPAAQLTSPAMCAPLIDLHGAILATHGYAHKQNHALFVINLLFNLCI